MNIDDSWSSCTMNLVCEVPPFRLVADMIYYVFDLLPEIYAEKIATFCRCKYPNQSWKIINCASSNLDRTLKTIDWGDDGVIGLSSSCRTYAHAFMTIFKKLKIPHSGVTTKSIAFTDGYSHVVNIITLHDIKKNPISYMLDVDWAPSILYPKTEFTPQYHLPIIPKITLQKSECKKQ